MPGQFRQKCIWQMALKKGISLSMRVPHFRIGFPYFQEAHLNLLVGVMAHGTILCLHVVIHSFIFILIRLICSFYVLTVPLLGMIDGTLSVENGPNPSLPWRETYSCDSHQGSNIYSIKIPKQYKYITFLTIFFCSDTKYELKPINAFDNSSLDQVGACIFSHMGGISITYTCNKLVSLDEIGHSITIHMKEKIPLYQISAALSSGTYLSCV
jgi:hypothetical protein